MALGKRQRTGAIGRVHLQESHFVGSLYDCNATRVTSWALLLSVIWWGGCSNG